MLGLDLQEEPKAKSQKLKAAKKVKAERRKEKGLCMNGFL
jgi:hypothetical protein